jgi:hypothetical protein
MIKPSELIKYMREHRTGGDDSTWSIDYGVNLAIVSEKSQLPLPCFYVELNTTTAEVTSEGDFEQLFRTNIRVRLVCLNREDRMGRLGSDVAFYARLELFKILLFKKLDARYNQVYFVGDGFEQIDEARYIHTFDFMFTGRIPETFIEYDDFVDLESIYIDYNLVDSAESEKPNAQEVLNTFLDDA